jgi:hypothetical protein
VQRALVRVDGEAFTYQQITERTGLTLAQAQQRVGRARKQGKGVSWSHLQPIFFAPSVDILSTRADNGST